MVKGIAKQVLVMKVPDSPLVEEAIFLLRDTEGISQEALLREARRIAREAPGRKHTCPGLRSALFLLAGALPVGTAWLLWAIL